MYFSLNYLDTVSWLPVIHVSSIVAIDLKWPQFLLVFMLAAVSYILLFNVLY